MAELTTELDSFQNLLIERELARRSYKDYLSYVNKPIWKKTRMSSYIADQVQEFLMTDTGNAYDILVIACPPQHGKSVTISESLPSWYLGKFPNNRVIMASYNEDTASKFARRNSEKIRQYGKQLFGIEMGKIDRAEEFELSNSIGRCISRGILSGITGNPANLMLIDDPIKNRQEADSPTTRDSLWNEWQNTLKSRLAAKAKVILIMTPWHEDDLRARIIATEPSVSLLRLPIEAEENDPLGRTPGDALCPELGKDNAWLAQFKQSYINDPEGGLRAWNALYMCTPRTEEGNMVKREWWKYYNPTQITQFGPTVISVDATFKGETRTRSGKTRDTDYVAITVVSKLGNDYYCRYCMNKRMDLPETLQAIRSIKAMYPHAGAVLIEDKANGPAVIRALRTEMFCIAINPMGGKVARVNAVSPAIESGHVYLPINTPWTGPFIDQWTAFPNGAHEDMCDSLSQALNHLLFSNGAAINYNRQPTEEERASTEADEMFVDSSVLFNPYHRV